MRDRENFSVVAPDPLKQGLKHELVQEYGLRVLLLPQIH